MTELQIITNPSKSFINSPKWSLIKSEQIKHANFILLPKELLLKEREKVLKFLKNIKFFSLSVFMYIYSKATAFLTLPILVDRPLIYNIYFTKVSSKTIRNTNDVDGSQPNTHLNILHFLKN